jgi:acyl homoserine lactone synthase
MLKDIFGELLGGRAAPQAADVWEISRFAVLSPAKGPRTLGSVHRVTSDMLVTLFEFALQSNIRQVIAASEIRFERILRRAGLVTHRFAEPRPIGRTLAVAGWADVSDDTLLRIRTASCARRKAARTNLMPLTRSGSRSSERDPEFPHADAAG